MVWIQSILLSNPVTIIGIQSVNGMWACNLGAQHTPLEAHREHQRKYSQEHVEGVWSLNPSLTINSASVGHHTIFLCATWTKYIAYAFYFVLSIGWTSSKGIFFIIFWTFLISTFKNKHIQNLFSRSDPFGHASQTGVAKQYCHTAPAGLTTLFGHAALTGVVGQNCHTHCRWRASVVFSCQAGWRGQKV